ncbi:MAG TPA: SRPBCC family protein [Candidatus Dormibacteraeota bacterium]|nr:SRPBCC family protein [Candidatus Dormibacteraeota bacterium]
MLRKLLSAIIVVVVMLLGVAYILPQQVHVERSISIDRPAAVVFPLLNSPKRFNEWSPWKDLDPNVRMSYTGPESGVGAAMAWSGNSKVGKGSQVITESVADQRVKTDLDFGEMGAAKAVWELSAADNGTKIVWSLDMDVGNNPLGRYMGVFMDKMVGPDYERGLKQLKALAEKEPAPEAAQPASAPTTSPNAPTS